MDKKAHLLEMFGASVPNDVIENICLNECNLETCVEYLIKYVENVRRQNSSKEQQTKTSRHVVDRNSNVIVNKPSSDKCKSVNDAKENNTPVTLSQGAIPKSFNENIPSPMINGSNSKSLRVSNLFTKEYDCICTNIERGHKIMIIMRGPPGCGKTFLSKNILQDSLHSQDYGNHIFSTDDYFYNAKDQYIYDRSRLDEAHKFSQNRVLKQAVDAWSPLIIDNTSIKLWEMMPYVKIAVQHGYILELMQPNTSWAKSVSKLALKNKHGVPRESIQRMINNFEVGTSNYLISMLKEIKYTVTLPQLRRYPPFHAETIEDIPPHIQYPSDHNINDLTNFQEQSLIASNVIQKDTSPVCIENPPENSLYKNHDEWKPYEEESKQFWSIESKNDTISKPQRQLRKKTNVDNTLIDILSEPRKITEVMNDVLNDKCPQLEKHSLGCPNESKSFILLRQIYPNRASDDLWDLFEKCNGDVDWAISILMRDNTVYEHNNEGNDFKNMPICKCSQGDEPLQTINTNIVSEEVSSNKINSIQKPFTPKKSKDKLADPNVDVAEVKREIEKYFILGEEHYSTNLKKIRNRRYGLDNSIHKLNVSETKIWEDESENVAKNEPQSFTDMGAEETSEDGDEIVEVDLGDGLVDQLGKMFNTECVVNMPEQYTTNVFMPKSLAKQLYIIWMESIYNQIEEQRHVALKEDAEFARILDDPKYSIHKTTPNTYAEILDMELAWKIYKSDRNGEKWNSRPSDLASHLTRMKLCEIFPQVDKEILCQILSAHDNNFSATVEVLKNSIKEDVDAQMILTKDNLMEIVKTENEKVSDNRQQDNSPVQSHLYQTEGKRLSQVESKRLTLKDFEDCRNMAVHHSQLKAECYQKAKEAIQRGNSAVAVYYSQIANLHKSKIDAFNQKAANCIVEVHDLTQNNPDFIDLHYLHVIEAIACLDIFIDKNITKMKNLFRSYKYIFIITGRGLHSAGGISAIKNKVKSRLKERNLKWTEVNPGLLKVKIFSASKYSKNI